MTRLMLRNFWEEEKKCNFVHKNLIIKSLRYLNINQGILLIAVEILFRFPWQFIGKQNLDKFWKLKFQTFRFHSRFNSRWCAWK